MMRATRLRALGLPSEGASMTHAPVANEQPGGGARSVECDQVTPESLEQEIAMFAPLVSPDEPRRYRAPWCSKIELQY